MTSRWTAIDKVNSFNHRELTEDDVCLFLYTRETHGYNEIGSWSYAYQTIENFKISPQAIEKNPARSKYKREAIDIVAEDLKRLFAATNSETSFLLVPAVTSKSKDDPDYDDRLVEVCRRVSQDFAHVEYADMLSMSSSVPCAHTGEGSRDVEEIVNRIVVDPNVPVWEYSVLLIFDDVISSGAHFKACKAAIERVYGDVPIDGVFWARTASWGEQDSAF